MEKTIIFIEGEQEQTKEPRKSLKTKSVMEGCIILENAKFAVMNHDLRMDVRRSKHTMTIITNLFLSAGSASHATTNGTNTTNPSCLMEKESRKSPQMVLTSSTAASRNYAKISLLQELEKVWKASEAVFFSKSCAWPKKSSPSSYSLKTSLLSPHGADFRLLEKLPRWGMIVDGVLYPLAGSELYTDVKDGSYWLTPSTMESLPVREGKALDRALHRGNSMSKRKCSGRLNEQVAYPQMWPTPTKVQVDESYETYRKRMMNSSNPKNKGKTKPQNLTMAVKMWPTPKARDWKDSGEAPSERKRHSPNLPCMVKMIETP